MVDPNRKINRLTDKDIEFLDECEEEFGDRYTEDDSEFTEHCAKGAAEPPIVDNWNQGGNVGHGHNRGGGGQRNHYGSGNRGNRGWQRRRSGERDYRGGGERDYRGGGDREYRGGSSYHRNNHSRSYKPFEQHRRGGHEDGDNHRRYDDSSRNNERSRPPMNIRRDYGNFVAASESDQA